MPYMMLADEAIIAAMLQEFLPEVLRLPFKTVVADFLVVPWDATAAARGATPSSQARCVACSRTAAS